MNKNALWVEKYRPKTIDEYIFHNDAHKKAFTTMIQQKDIPNILLSGVQGSGKTTIARIIISSLGLSEADLLVINASDENNVDVVREKIKNFVTTFGFNDHKIIHLEECDYMTPNGQAILRVLMEDFSDVARFILTCNYEHKIIPAVRSRCQSFHFKEMNKNHIAEYVAKILIEENVSFDLETLDAYIDVGYPDIRKVVNLVQQNSIDGVLQKHATANETDYKFEILDLLKKNDWVKIRELLCANVVAEEWENIYKFMYDSLNKSPKFSKRTNWEEGVVVIAEHLEKHAIVADPEINAAAMFIRLGRIDD